MLLHRHPEALVEALRQVPRSRPFESMRDAGGARPARPGRRQPRRRRPRPSPRGGGGLRRAAAAGAADRRGARGSRRSPGREAGSRARSPPSAPSPRSRSGSTSVSRRDGDTAAAPDYSGSSGGLRREPPGVGFRTLDHGNRMRLLDRHGHEVTIYGYEREPYARILRSGTVQVNQRSPATYLNRNRLADVVVPPFASALAPPRWRIVGHSGTFTWIDHRTHWIAGRGPAPGQGHEPQDEGLRLPDPGADRRSQRRDRWHPVLGRDAGALGASADRGRRDVIVVAGGALVLLSRRRRRPRRRRSAERRTGQGGLVAQRAVARSRTFRCR